MLLLADVKVLLGGNKAIRGLTATLELVLANTTDYRLQTTPTAFIRMINTYHKQNMQLLAVSFCVCGTLTLIYYNIKLLKVKTGVDIIKTASWKIKSLLPVQCVLQQENYRIGLLNILLETKYVIHNTIFYFIFMFEIQQ